MSRIPIFKDTILLIDLDDTLYVNEEVTKHMRRKIAEYMICDLGMDSDESQSLLKKHFVNSGTTLAGLLEYGYPVDIEKYQSSVHNTIDYGNLIKADIVLIGILEKIQYPMYIFTNGPQDHAEACLHQLGLSHCFKEIFSFESLQKLAHNKGLPKNKIYCKPNLVAFEIVLEALGVQSNRILFFDDSLKNIDTGLKTGMNCIWVSRGTKDTNNSSDEHNCYITISSLHKLAFIMPQLFFDPTLFPSSQGEAFFK